MDHDEARRLRNLASLCWLRNALKYISEAILPGLGDVLLSGVQLVIANRLEFCLFCMQVYKEFCWLALEAVLLRLCIASISIHIWLRLNNRLNIE